MVAPDKLVESSMDRGESKGGSDRQTESVTNGNEEFPANSEKLTLSERCEDTGRQPSYVALACCISGYTTLHYDTAKQRQALRSHPVSPVRPVTNGNENHSLKSGNYLFPNSNELNFEMQSDRKGVEVLPGCGGLNSPRHMLRMSVTSESRRNFTSSMISENYSSSYSSSSGATSSSHYSSHQFSTSNSSPTATSSYSRGEVVSNSTSSSSSTTEIINGGSKLIAAMKAPSQVSPSSFIVQRVERLYGPGALAQKFYSPRRISTISKDTNGSPLSNGCQRSDSSDSLPVLKLLRPEFRAQLTVASRKSKGSTDQKPLSDSNGSLHESDNLLKTELPRAAEIDQIDATLADKISKAVVLEEIRDGHFYLKLLDEKVLELEALAQQAEDELLHCENDEGCGMLRAASGKARLLVAEKLNQFRGLCYNNLKQSEKDDFPTTNEDLAGFWDMVLIQIKEMFTLFEDLERAKNNAWKEDVNANSKVEIKSSAQPQKKTCRTTRKVTTPAKGEPSKASSELRKARDEARKKLIEEKRKAMKNKKEEEDNALFIV